MLSLYQFKCHLLRSKIASGQFTGQKLHAKKEQLAKFEEFDFRNTFDGQSPQIGQFWDRWGKFYGESGLVNPRGDRLLTELTVRVLRELLPTTIFVVGWTYRRMRRSTLLAWNRLADGVAVDVDLAPGWFIRERGPRSLATVFSPVWENAKAGLLGVLNSYVLTIPACAMWLFARRFGWDNSFHKLYEQYAIDMGSSMTGA